MVLIPGLSTAAAFLGLLAFAGTLAAPLLLSWRQAVHNREAAEAQRQADRDAVDRVDLRSVIDDAAAVVDLLCDAVDVYAASIDVSGGIEKNPHFKKFAVAAWDELRQVERHRTRLRIRLTPGTDGFGVVACLDTIIEQNRDHLRDIQRTFQTGDWGTEEFKVIGADRRTDRWAQRDAFLQVAADLAKSELRG